MATWKLIGDVTLCPCWVHITHDLLTGNEMELGEIWSRIMRRVLREAWKFSEEVVKVFKVVGKNST